jgi:hypothetical protein
MAQPIIQRPWRNSVASKLLTRDIEQGAINDETAPREAYRLRAEYQQHDYNQFRARLNDYRTKMRKKKLQSQVEVEALLHDLQIHQAAQHGGAPRWDGSEAQQLLREAVQARTDRLMPPRELWLSNTAYQVFELATFRQHISQERRRQKFLRWLNNNNNSQT